MAKAFNYTSAIRDLCVNICRTTPEFSNFDLSRVGFSINKARNTGTRIGNWASVTPLRFEYGLRIRIPEAFMRTLDVNPRTVARATDVASNVFALEAESFLEKEDAKLTVRYGSERMKKTLVLSCEERLRFNQTIFYRSPQVVGLDGKTELLYLFSVMIPRFYDLSCVEKLETIMHELYHISEAFDGDVRRFPGRNWQHGSKKAYQARAAKFARDWLAKEPDPALFNFLQYDSRQLAERFGRLVGAKFPRIPVVPITFEAALKHEPRLAELIVIAQAKGRLK